MAFVTLHPPVMLLRLPLLVLLVLSLGSALRAQLNYTSPEVLPDQRVVLRLHAPAAEAVVVHGIHGVGRQSLEKGEDGVWSVTLGPLPADIYSYWFEVDGARVLDPVNRFTKDWLRMESAFEVTGEPERAFAIRDVPHGIVHRHTLHSRTRGGPAAFLVYTPPGYDPAADTELPVVFVLHGFGDDERAWADFGRAPVIADNLIADERMEPMIIVMPNGHPLAPPRGNRAPDYFDRNLVAMEQEVLEEILPAVEAAYRVRRDAKGRAIVGLSMGGGHSLGIGLKHPEIFGWIGGFSSATPEDNLDERLSHLVSTDEKNAEPLLLWIACGRDDFLIERNERFVAWLAAHDVPHIWRKTAGNHSWPVWRAYLEEFLPMLFRGR